MNHDEQTYLKGVLHMKKVSSLLLASSLVVALSGCSSNTSTDKPAATAAPEATKAAATTAPAASEDIKPEAGATLLVWEAKEWRPFMDEIIKQFTAKYNIQVKMDEVGAGDQVNKLTNDGPAGIGADVVVFPHDNLGKAVAAGLVLPNDFYGDVTTKENSDVAIQGATFGGKLYGYPRSVETYAMFYNKDLIPQAPKTMEEVKTFAKTFNDPGKNKYAFMWDVGNFYFSYPYLSAQGGYVFGKNGTDKSDIGLANDGAVKGAAYFASLKKDVLPLKSGDVNYDIKKGLFTGGTLAMNVDGPWAIGDIKKSGIKFGVAPLPSMDGKPAVSFAGIKAWYVNSYSKYPKAARLFARFASDQKAQLLEYKTVGSLPANKAVAEDPAVKGDEIVTAFLQQFKTSQAMPSIAEMGNVWTPIGGALGEIWNDGKDPKAALDNAVKQIKDGSGAK
jgi:arabinogalactan oligomer / maltooligosaccharide transport system substrate-binding protein